jgi:hypothetical protein
VARGDCEKRREDIHLLAEGLIQAHEAPGLAEHLSVCADCEALLRDLRAVADALTGLPEPEPPREFVAQVRRRVQAETAAEPALGWGPREWGVAAGCVLAVVLSLWLVARFAYVPWDPFKSTAAAVWESIAAEGRALASNPSQWVAEQTASLASARAACASGWATATSHLAQWRVSLIVAFALASCLNAYLYRTAARPLPRTASAGGRRG